jgi:hypothetical protein
MRKSSTASSSPGWAKWLKRVGWGGFIFFLIKGLLWLVLIYWIGKKH